MVEDNFVPALKPRIAIHSAAYGACTCGHAWLTLDGEVIANFCTRAYYNRAYYNRQMDRSIGAEEARRYEDPLVEYGEMSRQDVYEACWLFVHDLSFDDAIKSDDPLIQALMVLDKRLGTRRMATLDIAKLHPLAHKLLEIRQGTASTAAAR